MELFLVTFGIMVMVVAAMAIGAIMGRKPIQGSCGGLGKLMGEDCEFCEKKDQCSDEEKSRCDGRGKVVLRAEAGCPVELKIES